MAHAFDRGIRGERSLPPPSSFDTLQQLFRTNVRRTDTVQRGQHPEQHVIQPTVSPARSTAYNVLGSSTTRILLRSRFGSRQNSQSSPSAILRHWR